MTATIIQEPIRQDFHCSFRVLYLLGGIQKASAEDLKGKAAVLRALASLVRREYARLVNYPEQQKVLRDQVLKGRGNVFLTYWNLIREAVELPKEKRSVSPLLEKLGKLEREMEALKQKLAEVQR